jgi:hypothetical protein
MKKQTCTCHPYSPFFWAKNPQPSIFMRDPFFRARGWTVIGDKTFYKEPEPKGQKTKTTKENELVAYKEFGIFLRAQPNIKPTKNKHEI